MLYYPLSLEYVCLSRHVVTLLHVHVCAGCCGPTLTATESQFFKNSILSPWKHGASSIQALLASLSPYYDIRSMCLYVYSLPTSYTAQHLLKLFQIRYPSAFKAEILKGDRDGVEERLGSSEEEDGETDDWSSGEDGEGRDEEARPQRQGRREATLLSGLRRSGKGSSVLLL